MLALFPRFSRALFLTTTFRHACSFSGSSLSLLRFRPSSSSRPSSSLAMASDRDRSWEELRTLSLSLPVGAALESDRELRSSGRGDAHVENTLRLFDKADSSGYVPRITLYRDVAGWCPYCQKTVMLLEEKGVPCFISTVPMRSYGDKPTSFTRLVPSGLLPAMVVDEKHVVTESQVIMETIERMYPPSDGYPAMLPDDDDAPGWKTYRDLARLERDLFGRWCNLIFRPEMPQSMPGGNLLNKIMGGDAAVSPAQRGFEDCLDQVDAALRSTPGPWFTTLHADRPAMIDLIFVSHVERMLASAAYWKGIKIRGTGRWKGLDAWFDAFDQRPSYRAFKSDFYTNVMDIPPQYGPGFFGGDPQTQKSYADMINGQDSASWSLPLPPASPLEPLGAGPPLPSGALAAAGLEDHASASPADLARAARHAAAWKLAGNGSAVSAFAARGGREGARNPRKTFAAPLADPYAEPDRRALPAVDRVLRVVCQRMLEGEGTGERMELEVEEDVREDVKESLRYVRDRVGVPRDMPLAAARQFRAHLNLAMQSL